MVSFDPTVQPQTAPEHNGHTPPRNLGTEIGGLVESMWRIADLQIRLWVGSVKRAAGRIILATVFGAVSIVMIIAAAIFFFAGIFHILTDFLHVPTAWALLIYAGVFALAALTLVLSAVRVLKRHPKQEESPT